MQTVWGKHEKMSEREEKPIKFNSMKSVWQSYALARFSSVSQAVSNLWHYSECGGFFSGRLSQKRKKERKMKFEKLSFPRICFVSIEWVRALFVLSVDCRSSLLIGQTVRMRIGICVRLFVLAPSFPIALDKGSYGFFSPLGTYLKITLHYSVLRSLQKIYFIYSIRSCWSREWPSVSFVLKLTDISLGEI